MRGNVPDPNYKIGESIGTGRIGKIGIKGFEKKKEEKVEKGSSKKMRSLIT